MRDNVSCSILMTKTKLDKVISIETDFLFALKKGQSEKRIGILRNISSDTFIDIKTEPDGFWTGVAIISNNNIEQEKKFQDNLCVHFGNEETEIYIKISLLNAYKMSNWYLKSYHFTELKKSTNTSYIQKYFDPVGAIIILIVVCLFAAACA